MNLEPSLLTWFLQQGPGFALAGIMFFVYRKDQNSWAQRSSEGASAYMQYGKETAVATAQLGAAVSQVQLVLSQLAANVAKQTEILERIEQTEILERIEQTEILERIERDQHEK